LLSDTYGSQEMPSGMLKGRVAKLRVSFPTRGNQFRIVEIRLWEANALVELSLPIHERLIPAKTEKAPPTRIFPSD